jgi:hypothetical protein
MIIRFKGSINDNDKYVLYVLPDCDQYRDATGLHQAAISSATVFSGRSLKIT